ncbi:MAG: chemotaxis protein MotB [Rhodobacteraceae bacterium]|nr:chemotaxis protein MotB [Paracoccaceae bacterium]
MAANAGRANAPRIVRKRRRAAEAGHHGGAWKVAYADFVTAMMAFFMLMWLINATTEKQRKGLADYFNPTIPINRASGGGDGAFGGDSIYVEERLAQVARAARTRPEEGAMPGLSGRREEGDGPPQDRASEEARLLRQIVERLEGRTDSAEAPGDLFRHVATRVTEAGLVIELFDLEEAPLFLAGRDVPRPVLRALAAVLAEALGAVDNPVSIAGHVAAAAAEGAAPVATAPGAASPWGLSAARAETLRGLIESGGVVGPRLHEVTGQGSRLPSAGGGAVRDNRLEVTILRTIP